MGGDIQTAKRQHVLVFRPLTLDQFRIQPLLLKETIFDRAENRGLTSNADIADPDFGKASARRLRICFAITTVPSKQHRTDDRSGDEFERSHDGVSLPQNRKEKPKKIRKVGFKASHRHPGALPRLRGRPVGDLGGARLPNSSMFKVLSFRFEVGLHAARCAPWTEDQTSNLELKTWNLRELRPTKCSDRSASQARQRSTGSRQSPITNHQSPLTSHLSPLTSHPSARPLRDRLAQNLRK